MEDLDDRVTREAFEAARRGGVRKYNFLFHHCQHFAMDDIMPRYERIMTQRMLGLRSDTERLSGYKRPKNDNIRKFKSISTTKD